MAWMIYRKGDATIAVRDGESRALATKWDDLFRQQDVAAWLATAFNAAPACDLPNFATAIDPPIVSQEVWAAGVTYYRSRDARMAESADAGGGTFYDRVYAADRPELFFKGNARRTAGHRQPLRIRVDSKWNVPEPELTLAINAFGRIFGYTVGNDMSSRDIEGANPLYLPQAKVYDGCCGLGPGVCIPDQPLDPSTTISLTIRRGQAVAFEGQTTLDQLKRKPDELAGYLFRDQSFPDGCFLLTGTGVIPGDDFTLQPDDEVTIAIAGVGELINTVTRA